jgi:hypothetical protein
MPFSGLLMSSIWHSNSSVVFRDFMLKRLSSEAKIIFSSIIAKRCPMQFLLPAENGINAKGGLFLEFSGKNLLGSNFSASGKYLSSR